MQTIRYGKARLARFQEVKVYTFERNYLTKLVRRVGITSTERR